jgi:hypothetical protein
MVALHLGGGGIRPALRRTKSMITTHQISVLQPWIALIAGILILIFPRILNYIVAIYLILIGIAGLIGHFHL